MKKIIITLIMFLVPFSVSAADVDYKITNYHIEANILENGDMKVKELLVIDGSLNGYERDIYYKNNTNANIKEKEDHFYLQNRELYQATNVDHLKVSSFYLEYPLDSYFNSNIDYFNISYYASAGDNGVYTVSDFNNGYRIRTFAPTRNKKRVFYYEYTVKDAVILHNDTSELYWMFVGNEFDDTIRDINIKINLPDSDTANNFRVWAYGNIEGEITRIGDNDIYNGASVSVPKLKSGNFIEARLLFSKDLISEDKITKKSGLDAFDKIIEIEEAKAERVNAKIKRAKILNWIFTGAYSALIIAIAGIWIYVYKKYDKEYEPQFKGKYYREFIEEYDVEVIDYLMNHNITSNAMSASIMNLIYKKKIEVEELDKKKGVYSFKLINMENLSENEDYLVKFLFEKVGSGQVFTTKNLKDYAKSTKTYSKFTSSYENWKQRVIGTGKSQNFYEGRTKALPFGICILLLGIGLFGINVSLVASQIFNTINVVGILALILSIIFFIYTLSFTRRTKTGNEQYHMWKAFKNFLNDFGSFKQKELPEIILWERYLVYAVIFGLADKVQKTMNVKIKEYRLEEATNVHTDFWLNYYLYSSLSRNINRAVSSSVNAAVAAGSSVSGSGGGGGFSSGGGFGGGGGGGRGF